MVLVIHNVHKPEPLAFSNNPAGFNRESTVTKHQGMFRCCWRQRFRGFRGQKGLHVLQFDVRKIGARTKTQNSILDFAEAQRLQEH
jgi:hypothetical protein